MTQANPANYEIAAHLVDAGEWRVDAAQGLVFGKQGRPFRRTNTWGYIQIKFRDPENWRVDRAVLAHRVIWETVHGPLAPDLTINHINGNKQDNRMVNLEAVTQAENVRHAFATGLNQPHPPLLHCKRGHAYDEANTRVHPRGGRTCRACDRTRAAKYRAARISPVT